MRLAEMIKTGGFSAIAAAMALAALPGDASAKDNGDRHGWSQGSGRSDSRNSSERSNWRSSRSESRQSSAARTPPGSNAPRVAESYRQAPPRSIAQPGAPTYRPAETRRVDRTAERSNRSVRSIPVPASNARSYADASRNRSYADPDRDRSYGSGNWGVTRSADTYTTFRGRSGDGYRNRDGDRDYRNRSYAYNSREYRRDGDRYRDYRQWNRGWRDNRRYDWYDYRNRNRSIFHLGFYYAPYSYWSYRPLSIGFYLDSLFYSSRYWVDDPWRYRLPEVYGPYRWVRYYDDVLLVNIYSGEVVDVIHDFFW